MTLINNIFPFREIINQHENNKTSGGTCEDDRGRRHAGRLRRETSLPDQ